MKDTIKHNMKQKYTILDYPTKKSTYGKYEGEKPFKAAQKAFKVLSKKYDLTKNSLDTKMYLEFTIKNIENKKKYTYLGTKVKLHSPITVLENNVLKKYHYKNLIYAKPSEITTIQLDKLFHNYDKAYNTYNRNRSN